MLELKNISAGYGECTVLWDVSISVKEGEFVALLGSNGAGKTTTLFCISGLIVPSQGEITFLGKNICGCPTHEISRQGISFVPEDGRLFLEMTVWENLVMGAFCINQRSKVNENLTYMLDLFPRLKERRKQLAGTLSGGERKMLSIARGLMANPKILLVDEPSLGLAPKMVVAVFEVLKELSSQGVTILLVEQNTNTTLEITDRAYVLEHGKVVLEGKSSQLLENDHIKKSYLGII
jgi:branched-chain amino acid transport system ATP-binding protein